MSGLQLQTLRLLALRARVSWCFRRRAQRAARVLSLWGYVDTLLVFPSTPASHMASTAVRFPTPQRVDGSTQHTSVEVTDPLLCPPELGVVTRVSRPCICLCWGVLAPRRLASPQSLSCAKQHVYSLVPRRRRRLLLFYSTRHWYNVRRIVGGDRDLNAPCWLRRYAACFLIINAGVSHGRNGGALLNAPTRRRFHPTHVC